MPRFTMLKDARGDEYKIKPIPVCLEDIAALRPHSALGVLTDIALAADEHQTNPVDVPLEEIAENTGLPIATIERAVELLAQLGYIRVGWR